MKKDLSKRLRELRQENCIQRYWDMSYQGIDRYTGLRFNGYSWMNDNRVIG